MKLFTRIVTPDGQSSEPWDTRTGRATLYIRENYRTTISSHDEATANILASSAASRGCSVFVRPESGQRDWDGPERRMLEHANYSLSAYAIRERTECERERNNAATLAAMMAKITLTMRDVKAAIEASPNVTPMKRRSRK